MLSNSVSFVTHPSHIWLPRVFHFLNLKGEYIFIHPPTHPSIRPLSIQTFIPPLLLRVNFVFWCDHGIFHDLLNCWSEDKIIATHKYNSHLGNICVTEAIFVSLVRSCNKVRWRGAFHSHVEQWGEGKKRWLRRRRRTRHGLLACAVAEEKTVAEGDEERREGGNHRCRRGYWWEGWVGAGECHLKRRPSLSERFSLCFGEGEKSCNPCLCAWKVSIYRWAGWGTAPSPRARLLSTPTSLHPTGEKKQKTGAAVRQRPPSEAPQCPLVHADRVSPWWGFPRGGGA